MAEVSFGFVPVQGTMYLSRYGDFVAEIVSDTGVWPDNAEVEFRFQPANTTTFTVWTGTVSGALATWNVDKVQVAALLDAGATEYLLMYTQDTYDLEWSKGPVKDVS
jgi:hypothetical protein